MHTYNIIYVYVQRKTIFLKLVTSYDNNNNGTNTSMSNLIHYQSKIAIQIILNRPIRFPRKNRRLDFGIDLRTIGPGKCR